VGRCVELPAMALKGRPCGWSAAQRRQYAGGGKLLAQAAAPATAVAPAGARVQWTGQARTPRAGPCRLPLTMPMSSFVARSCSVRCVPRKSNICCKHAARSCHATVPHTSRHARARMRPPLGWHTPAPHSKRLDLRLGTRQRVSRTLNHEVALQHGGWRQRVCGQPP